MRDGKCLLVENAGEAARGDGSHEMVEAREDLFRASTEWGTVVESTSDYT